MQIMSAIVNFFRKLFPNFLLKKPALSIVPPIEAPLDPTAQAPLWYKIAYKEIGVKEFIPGDNPRIVEYHMATRLKATHDQISWCSSFVCWCLESAGMSSTRNAWARSYLDWGIYLEKPRLGCIVIFSRGLDSGHVAFFTEDRGDNVLVLGGNQKDSVCFAEYEKSKILGYRWPR